MRKINRDQKEYQKYLAMYLRTKEGSKFAGYILSQLIEGFDVKRNEIKSVHIDDTKPIVLDFS